MQCRFSKIEMIKQYFMFHRPTLTESGSSRQKGKLPVRSVYVKRYINFLRSISLILITLYIPLINKVRTPRGLTK